MYQPDRDMLRDCIKQQPRALEAFYKGCHPVLMRVAWRYATHREDARELLNQAFIRLLDQLKRYDAERPFEPWAKRVAVNAILGELKRRRTWQRQHSLLSGEELTLLDAGETTDAPETNLSAEEVMLALQTLPPLQRTLLNLVAVDGYTHAEVAQQLEISVAASRWHLHQARQTLRRLLAEREQDPHSATRNPKSDPQTHPLSNR